MHTVLAYDVVHDGKRARFFKRLKALLVPVQRSVFEGPLPASHRPRLEGLISGVLDLTVDSVRVYSLCPACRARTQSYGTCPELADPNAPIVL